MSQRKKPAGPRIVYSTERGRIRADEGRVEESVPEGDGVVRVRVEKKGRRGKVVTTMTGLPLTKSALKALAKDLRKRCGAGGTVKDGVVEIQGDHCDLLLAALEERGFTAKRSGG